jgi:hypothetical protein
LPPIPGSLTSNGTVEACSEAAVETHTARGIVGAAGDRLERHANQGIAGGGLRRLLVGVVPVGLVAGDPGLGTDLLQVEDARSGPCENTDSGAPVTAAIITAPWLRWGSTAAA